MTIDTRPDCKIDYVDHMGSDLTVVNAARVSFKKHKEKLDSKDERLINYLARNAHWTPFAHCMLQLKFKTPIFVARQLFKHQVGFVVNEVSRRYVDERPEFFMPLGWRLRAEHAKQGSSDQFYFQSEELSERVFRAYEGACSLYEEMIKADIAPEQARMVLPQGAMTEWYWTGSLAAWARLCRQRLDPHAQQETRETAEIVNAIAGSYFPLSWKALMKNGDQP